MNAPPRKLSYAAVQYYKMYHIVRNVPDNKNFWFYIYISEKLRFFRWLLRDIVKFSAFDVELDMRMVYQKQVLGGVTDHGHAAWNEYLKGSSLVYTMNGMDSALKNVPYLNKLAYLVALKRVTIENDTWSQLRYLDLATDITGRCFNEQNTPTTKRRGSFDQKSRSQEIL